MQASNAFAAVVAEALVVALADAAGADAGDEAAPVFPPPLLLLPHPDMTSAMAAIPAITALVRRPRTISSLSTTGRILRRR
jgi:hypothetical protein